jgi:hypothetical protein
VREFSRSSANDFQSRLAIRIGASDQSVRCHPVVLMRHSLLSSKERQYGGFRSCQNSASSYGLLLPLSSLTKAVDTNALAWRQIHHLALQCEIVAFFRATEDTLAWRANNFNAKVVQFKFVLRRHNAVDCLSCPGPQSLRCEQKLLESGSNYAESRYGCTVQYSTPS